eukprot:TRINITY_DN22247_c0_g1_i1.p1 TRINITY_DN22247_c0_g1~~TRINITY_DN22247_c0_g1_i1.p1  ORF type:complete len:439 (+),score=49.76 TRINITY_DN22247_c0_g1_i1:59-1375(+)
MSDVNKLRWRWQDEAGLRLVGIESSCKAVAEPAGQVVELGEEWTPQDASNCVVFTCEQAEFVHGVKLKVRGGGSFSFSFEYANDGGAGEAKAAAGGWESVTSASVPADDAEHDVAWPDVGAHNRWRLRADAGQAQVQVKSLLTRSWTVNLQAATFGKANAEMFPGLPASAASLIQSGEVVLGDNDLLSQLYHESDLLGWGTPISFSCFMTLWAKRSSAFDFAVLVHRFRRIRPPLLVLSGTGVEHRERLRRQLKSLLRPEFMDIVKDVSEPDEVIDLLWRSKGETKTATSPSSLEEVNRGLQQLYARLGVPEDLRYDYATQFRRRDPLMLLLTKEVFGSWAPNRVFAEITGHDIFRTYAEFSCVDGVVCAEDAVWLHEPHKFYEPAPNTQFGDKRPAEFIELVKQQKPYIDAKVRGSKTIRYRPSLNHKPCRLEIGGR